MESDTESEAGAQQMKPAGSTPENHLRTELLDSPQNVVLRVPPVVRRAPRYFGGELRRLHRHIVRRVRRRH